MTTTKTVRAPKRRPNGSTRPAPARQTWPTPRRTLALAAVAVAVIAGILIGVSLIGSGSTSKPTALAGSGATAILLADIPQQANVLGSPKAPVALVEYADLQCPYCGHFARDTLPTLIQRYVRPGKLRIEFRGLAFLGGDSEQALRAAVAAGAQNRLWQMVDLLYRNQGEENTGWVTDGLLRSAAAHIPGLDPARLFEDRSSAATEAQIRRSAAQAASLMGSRIRTPTFQVGLAGRTPQLLQISSLDAGEFTSALDSLLEQ
jgi:protein-disulfide isomerase